MTTTIVGGIPVSQLPPANSMASSDKVVIVYTTSAGNTAARQIELKNLSANITIGNNVPATPSSNGEAGAIRYNSTHIYVCIANNVWKRAGLTTW